MRYRIAITTARLFERLADRLRSYAARRALANLNRQRRYLDIDN